MVNHRRRQLYCRISDETFRILKILATHNDKFDEEYLGELIEEHCIKHAEKHDIRSKLFKESEEGNEKV